MVGPIKNQDFNKYIEFLENQFISVKQELNSKASSIKLALNTDYNVPLDDEKLSTLFIRLYRFGRYKCYKLKCFCRNVAVIIKNNLSGINIPNISIPTNIKIPDISMPNVSLPKFNLPSINKRAVMLTSTCFASTIATFMFFSSSNWLGTTAEAQPEISEIRTENNIKFPTISINGQNFATDAKVVAEQLSSYNFYNNGKKVVYLTFDDGPTKYTPEILSVLKKYNIRATFFATGTALENSSEDIKKTLKESYVYGNSIGNHTYSHDYKTLYPNGSLNLNAFNNDLERNLALLRGVLGESYNTNIVRCPGGFNSWNNMSPLKEQLNANNQYSIDWNALTGDSSNIKSVKDMVSMAKETSEDKNVVILLMHETNKHTPEYLDELIRYYHNNGYEFRTIA